MPRHDIQTTDMSRCSSRCGDAVIPLTKLELFEQELRIRLFKAEPMQGCPGARTDGDRPLHNGVERVADHLSDCDGWGGFPTNFCQTIALHSMILEPPLVVREVTSR